jgi:hypothetical protein
MVKAATRTAGGYFQDAGEFSSLEEALAGYLGVWCDPDLSEVVAVTIHDRGLVLAKLVRGKREATVCVVHYQNAASPARISSL